MCMGMAASMGAFLLSGGTKGKRLALPNAEIMIHQPSGGAQGQATEIEIAAEHILRTKKKLNTILSENTGQPYETIVKDTERDNWLTAQEALEYGLPAKLSVLADHNQFDEFEKLYGAECVECGSCSFVCPAKRNLAQSMKTGRKQVLANRRKK